jgi:hypothetical protein
MGFWCVSKPKNMTKGLTKLFLGSNQKVDFFKISISPRQMASPFYGLGEISQIFVMYSEFFYCIFTKSVKYCKLYQINILISQRKTNII